MIDNISSLNTIQFADCFDLMATLEDASIDALITDMPYGTTRNKWDSVIDLRRWWLEVVRLLKASAPFITTAAQPFTSALVMSNPDWFRESLVWDKVLPVGFLNAKRKHLRSHEDILVFANGQMLYNPQMSDGDAYTKTRGKRQQTTSYGKYGKVVTTQSGRYPKSIICISNANRTGSLHPTQKPVGLYEYLIKTYTPEGGVILDPFSGSGTIAIAAINTGRQFICGDSDEQIVRASNERLRNYIKAIEST